MMANRRIIKFLSASICWGLAVLLFFMNHSLTTFAAEEDPASLSYNSVVEVESYEIEDGYIRAGKENIIKLKIKNANKHSAVTGLVAVVSSSSGLIYPKYGIDNQFVVGSLAGGASATIEIPVVAASKLAGEYVDFTCNLNYAIGGVKLSNSSTMILPTQNMSAVVINTIDMSANASLNGKSLLSISYSNNSAENVNDAVLVVTGSVSNETRLIDLGSVAAGKSYNKDCFITFTETGEQTVTIALEYTTGNGERVEHELGSYIVNVVEQNAPDQTAGALNPVFILVGRIVSVVAVLVAAIVIFVYVKKR
jgi:hypothetical protein